MKPASPFPLLYSIPNSSAIFILLIAGLIGVATGCGSGGISGGGPKLSGNTTVTMLMSSTANTQLSRFDIHFKSIALTNKAGKTVNLLAAPQAVEFIHVNGGADPLATVTIPQDIYTAASATIEGAQFTCATLTPSGGLDVSIFAYGETPDANVSVNLPSPITVTGDSMFFSLDMLVSQSATYGSCYVSGIDEFSITPTFNLTPLALSSQPTNTENGKVTALEGQITGISGSGFNITTPDGARTLSVASNSHTVYQGIPDFAALGVGIPVDMDGAIQPDGSVLATRIAVQDSDTTNLSVLRGPVLQTNSSQPMVVAIGRQQQGYMSTNHMAAIWTPFSFPDAVFHISGQMTNLQNLPFVPSFNGTNMVPGQNVYITTHATTIPSGYPYFPASTITLVPQTINGTVLVASNTGNFNVYTVSLPSYDLFPALAIQAGQANLVNNPSVVEVYVDQATQLLNSKALTPGSVLRFNGLVFNDNGTLRMDCAQVSDGAPE